MKQESCKNCAQFPGCLIRGAVMFRFFILTGRDKELPEDRENFNARGFCGQNYKPKENKE